MGGNGCQLLGSVFLARVLGVMTESVWAEAGASLTKLKNGANAQAAEE